MFSNDSREDSVCPTFDCADELLLAKRKGFEFLTITACGCCIGLTVCGVKLPEFTGLFFSVRGLVGPSEDCLTSDVVILTL